MIPKMTVGADLTPSEDLLSLKPGYAGYEVMQWETATPVGFPVCTRHNDCRLKKTAVWRLKAGMKQQVAFNTPSQR